MSQTPLYLAIFAVGLVIALTAGPRRDVALCCALAFPAGLAAAVLAAMLLLVVGIPYNVWTLGAATLIPTAALAFARLPAAGLDRTSLRLIATWTAGFGLVILALSHWNVSLLNWDSHRMVLLGGVIGRSEELDPRSISELQYWGVFQVVAHSMAAFTARDLVYALQPVLGCSLVALFTLALWRAVGRLGATGWRRTAAVTLATLALFSLYAFALHLVFIHTNLGTAVYLFGYVALFWLSDAERDPSGLPVAFLLLFALAVHRIETPLFALIALTATIFDTDLPRRAITRPLAVFTVLVASWYLVLAAHVSADSEFLTPTRCVAIAAAMIGFFGWWMISARPGLARFNRHLPLLAAVAAVLLLAAMFAVKTDHMAVSVQNWLKNLTMLPQWGYAWSGIALAVVVAVLVPAPPRHRMFTITIWLSLAATLMLVFPRTPYRFAFLDSAHRMTMHVLPLLFFYLALKTIPAVVAPSRVTMEADCPRADAGV